MAINLAATTTSITTTSGKLTASQFTFVADNSNDLRTKVFVVSNITGAPLASIHSVFSPKMVLFKRPANYALPSGYNTTTGRYGRVPLTNHRVMLKGSAQVAANQWENLPISMDIGVPAGAVQYDPANVEASIMAFIAALWDQKEELVQAISDGRY